MRICAQRIISSLDWASITMNGLPLLLLCGHEQHLALAAWGLCLFDGGTNLVKGEGECSRGSQNSLAHEDDDFALLPLPQEMLVEHIL